MVIDPLIISGSDDVVHERIPDNLNPDIDGICTIRFDERGLSLRQGLGHMRGPPRVSTADD